MRETRRALQSIRRASEGDVPALINTLVDAFSEDPFTNWLVRQDARKAEGNRLLFDTSLRTLTMPFGQVYTTEPDPHGAALWAPPGQWQLGLWRQLQMLPSFFTTAGFWRTPQAIRGLTALQNQHPTTKHYYLVMLGVRSAAQNQGLGTALLRPMLQRCDLEQVGAYLETANERNLTLYLRHGFEITREFVIPSGGPKMWLMWRAPNDATSTRGV